MTDDELADELVMRLNGLLKNPQVKRDIDDLFEQNVVASTATRSHSTLRVIDDEPNAPKLRVLGLLNGLLDQPLITAVYSEDDYLEFFERTKITKRKIG
jgi:hypothetical protein